MKSFSRRAAGVAAILAITLIVAACPRQATVADVKADPARYYRDEVVLQGTVSNSFGALNEGVYEIDDGTGKLWVLARRAVPSKGVRIATRGRIQQGLTFQGKNYAMLLVEEDRRSLSGRN